jgi:transglutaminase-like putative cysteine protease
MKKTPGTRGAGACERLSAESRNLSRASKRKIGALALAAILGCSGLPAVAQQAPSEPVEAPRPVPPDQLPPLNLPDLPGERRERPAEERPDIPAPPPPLPLPSGPAVVKAGLQPTGERHFKLFYDGEWIGWSKFRVTGEMKLGQTDAVIISSLGEIRVGFGGIVPAQFESRLMLDRTSLRPAYFKCVQLAGGGSFEVECVYSETMVAQTNRTADSRTVHFQDYTDKPPQLLFNNLWGHIDTFPEHYWIMVRSAVNGGVVQSYDPILRGGGDVIVYEPKTEDYKLDGRVLKAKMYPISDLRGTLLARVRVAAESFELLEVEEVGSGLKMVRTDAGIEKRLDKLKGLDLAQSRIVPSNVVFPDPEQLTALEAEVDITLRGGQLADHRIAGYRQYFTGELSEGVMKGRVFVRSVPREVPFDSPYPLEKKHVDPELLPLLDPGPGLEVEYPPLATKAREIAWKSPNSFEAAKRLNSFVTDIEEGVSLPSARYALESGVGNPESKALLLVAMSRAVGLPARKISGIAFRDGDFVPHHWVEIWLSREIGWTPFDPSTGEAGRVGAAHIALLDSGDIQNMSIRVTDYAPRATRKVPFIAQELKWTLGEKRTYGVYKDGERIGTEVAELGDLQIVDGEEVFRFTARSEIKGAAGTQVTLAEQLLQPNGLPRQIILSYKDAVKDEATTYSFGEDTVLIRAGKPGSEQYEKDKGREYPFARGTYFTDPRLLTQWALMAGQVPLTVGAEKEFPIHAFIPDRKTTREMLLEVGELEAIKLEPTLSLPEEEAEPDPQDEAEPAESSEAAPAPGDGSAQPAEGSQQPGEGQSADGEPSSGQQVEDGIVETRSTKELLEALTPADPNAVRATHLITDSGMEFWLNDRNQIIKMEIPDQGLELILEKVETSSLD